MPQSPEMAESEILCARELISFEIEMLPKHRILFDSCNLKSWKLCVRKSLETEKLRIQGGETENL